MVCLDPGHFLILADLDRTKFQKSFGMDQMASWMFCMAPNVLQGSGITREHLSHSPFQEISEI